MIIDETLVKKVAKNARIELSENETKEFIKELREILENFSKLDKLDTKNTKPSFHPIEIKNHLREDEKRNCLSNEEALRNAAHKKDGYFKGPRIV
ncbi:MAG: Asp-tRNA(Asn)/Glu-tRNA(Gln) amidotransferase subunit GatC [Candidatus Woesearchaeota archaeon]